MSELLRLDSVTKSFGGVTAVSDINLSMDEGDLVGVVGPNGAGKTSLVNCISGTLRPDSGGIALRGKPLQAMRPHRIAALGVARTLQLAEHFKEFRVDEYVLLGRQQSLSRSVWACGIGTPKVIRTEREQARITGELLEEFGLAEVSRRRLGELPYGLQKLTDLVRAVASEPVLLLLDEPTSGCSQQERQALKEHIARLRRSTVTCLIIDHDVDFLSHTCERLMAMALGRKIKEGSAAEVLADPDVVASYLGRPHEPADEGSALL